MDTIGIQCGRCSKHVGGQIIGHLHESDDEYRYDIHLLKCPACACAIVSLTASEFLGEWEEVGPPTRVFPAHNRELSHHTPAQVRHDFAEAQLCKSVGAFTASALLSRRVIEGIAADKGAKGSNLMRKIEALKASGDVDGKLADWANALRIVGNNAAHDTQGRATPEDASDALIFAEALADYVYTFRARFDEFQARQKPRPGIKTKEQP
jgi:Domain of unknown function (DUF4145)